MVKIAVIIIGHFRTFDKNYDSLLKELKNKSLEYDFFLHTWSTQNATTSSWHNMLDPPQDLTSSQISLLQSLDPDVEIKKQEFSEAELSDTICNKPCKAICYLFQALQKCLKRVEKAEILSKSNYDYILVTRYDVSCNNLQLDKIKIRSNEICIGWRFCEGYIESLVASDIIFMFNSKESSKFILDFDTYLQTHKKEIKTPEEIYTLFFRDNFKTISREWEYNSEIVIIR